jgi:hypothetical protein
MARKRIIDPDFYLDEDLASCGFAVKLFYIGTWNFADDYGVIEDSNLRLKAQIFPYDTIDVSQLRDKLVEIGKLVPFEAEGRKWLFVKNFLKYQRVDKPSNKRNPKPPFGEDSESVRLPLQYEEKRSKEKLSKKKRSKEELRQFFFAHKLMPGYQKQYPYRNYDQLFEEMCDWWENNKGKLPQAISSFKNWLERSKEDPELKRKAEREWQHEQQEKRNTQLQGVKVSPEKLAEFRSKKSLIGKTV